MNDEVIDWGIPDWQVADAYLPDWAAPGLFAWEFLRRNVAYRAKWREWRALLDLAGLVHWVPGQLMPSSFDPQRAPAKLWALSPPPEEGETLGNYENRIGEGTEYSMQWLGNAMAERWGHGGSLFDPRQPGWAHSTEGQRKGISMDGDVMLAFRVGTLPASFSAGDRQPPIVNSSAVAIYFDAADPIEPQIERAQAILKAAQDRLEKRGRIVIRKPPKKKPNPRHLRILDALEAGETSNTAIAKVLFPNERTGRGSPGDPVGKVKHARKEAEALRDGGWKALLLVRD